MTALKEVSWLIMIDNIEWYKYHLFST